MLEACKTVKHDELVLRAEVTGLVLCGGESRRMGRDKARLELEGRSLLERAIGELRPFVGEVVLACGATPRYAELGQRLALDSIEGGGPLSGLAAGLEAARGTWALVLGCDMPRVTRAHLAALLQHAVREDLDICIYAGSRGVEPLCGIYKITCMSPVRAALEAGERRMISFWDIPVPGKPGRPGRSLRIGQLPLVDSDGALVNLNTVEDFERERERARRERRESD